MVSISDFVSYFVIIYQDWIYPFITSPFPVFGTFLNFFLVSLLFTLVGVLLRQFWQDNSSE